MQIVKWNPMGNMVNISNRINDFFDDYFETGATVDRGFALDQLTPAVDIYDEGNTMVITAELPGMEKKDISIDFKEGILTLKGERTMESETKEENFCRRERAFGSFQRSFRLGSDLDPELIKADLKNGILKVVVPKREEQKPKQITIH